MKTFELEILEYNNFNVTESNLKRIVNDALKNYSAGEVIRVKEVIECKHNWVSSVAYKGAKVCSKCNKIQ